MKLKEPIVVTTLNEGPFGRAYGPKKAFVIAVGKVAFTLQFGEQNLGTPYGKASYRRSDGVMRGGGGMGHTDTVIVPKDFKMLSDLFPPDKSP